MDEKIKFYTDEHVHPAIVAGLRYREVNIISTKEAGLIGSRDEEHLAFALLNNRVLFTQDDDFLRFHAAGLPHFGIVYASQQTPPSTIIRGLLLIYEVLQPNDMVNHVEYL